MKNPQRDFLLGMVIGLFLILGYFGYAYQELKNNPVIDTDTKPILLFIFDQWGGNLNNTEEVLMSGYLYNFGFSEAKNVIITCPITFEDEEIENFEFKVGNIASNSYKFLELSKKYTPPKSSFATCKVKSCDDCINLDTRMSLE